MLVSLLRSTQNKSVFWRSLIFIVLLALIWLPFAIPLSLWLKNDPNLATIVTMGLLFVLFLVLQKIWGRQVHQQEAIFRQYGLSVKKISWFNLLKGLAIGFCLCWALFVTELIFGWVNISKLDIFLVKIIIEGLLSALGIALAEELVFRGWLVFEIERDCSQHIAIWASSLVFAIAHFLKPVSEIMRTAVTFPALFLLGLALVLAKRKFGNFLTISIGIHAGLVWGYYILNVGNLISYTGAVPDWITGIDGNPIAGVLGLVFMSGLVLSMRK